MANTMLGSHFLCAVVVSLALILAGQITMTLGADLSVAIGRDNTSDLVIFGIYLPHAVRVLAAYLFSWWAVVYQIPAMIWHFLIVGSYPLTLTYLSLVILFSLSAPLVFSLLKNLGIDIRGTRQFRRTWRPLLLVGLLSSIANASMLMVFMGPSMAPEEHMLLMTRMVAGDLAGLFVGLLLLMLGFRLYERVFRSPNA